MSTDRIPPQPRPSQPIFLVPGSVMTLAIILVIIEIVRGKFLGPLQNLDVLLTFAFIPARYAPEVLQGLRLPGGIAADVWTFLTYAFLHGSVSHLLVNVLWLMVFGTAVARRFGTIRFLAFAGLSAVAGAAFHLAFHFGEVVPVVGASAAISGLMAGASRFVFDPDGPLGVRGRRHPSSYFIPAGDLAHVFRNGRAVAFLLVWFGINIAIGLGAASGVAGAASVAWQAHIGGFLFGLLAFPAFDPVPPMRPRDGGHDGLA